jgi:hypothetical protein
MNALIQIRRYAAPVSLIAAGGLILYAQLTELNWLQYIWPVFIMLPGLPMLYIAWNSDEVARIRLIYPGITITGTGVVLLYQLITGHWHSWTYAWALYPVFFGLGLVFQGQRLNVKNDVRTGRWMVAGGIALFIILWLLFETVVFSGQYQGVMGYLLSGLLIGAGVVWAINKFRVARLLAKSQVIHAESPTGVQIRPTATPTEAQPPIKRDVNTQLEERRRRAGVTDSPELTSGETTDIAILNDDDISDADFTTVEDAFNTDTSPAKVSPSNPAPTANDESDFLTEYRPPTVSLSDKDTPSADVDADLQAKINAALNGDDS